MFDAAPVKFAAARSARRIDVRHVPHPQDQHLSGFLDRSSASAGCWPRRRERPVDLVYSIPVALACRRRCRVLGRRARFPGPPRSSRIVATVDTCAILRIKRIDRQQDPVPTAIVKIEQHRQPEGVSSTSTSERGARRQRAKSVPAQSPSPTMTDRRQRRQRDRPRQRRHRQHEQQMTPRAASPPPACAPPLRTFAAVRANRPCRGESKDMRWPGWRTLATRSGPERWRTRSCRRHDAIAGSRSP